MNTHLKSRVLCVSLLLSCLVSQFVQAESYGFFRPRNVTTDNVFQLALSNFNWYHERPVIPAGQDEKTEPKEVRKKFGMYVTPFFMQTSGRNGKKLANYFLPGNCDAIKVAEDGTGDVGSLWLGLIAQDFNDSYETVMTIRPQRRAFGAHFMFMYDMFKWKDNMWAALSFAAMRVQHELNLKECGPNGCAQEPGAINYFVEPDETTEQLTTLQGALNNPDWCACKFSPCTLKRSGVDDIELKIGYDKYWEDKDNNRLSGYILATIPTGKRPNGEFVFGPVVGSRQFSLGFGLDGEYHVTQRGNWTWTLLGDFKYRYGFSAKEWRCFDLCKNGDWSKYLLVVKEDAVANALPGVNYLTLKSNVTQRSIIDLFLAMHFEKDVWNVELGYDLWWHQAEKVSPDCCIGDFNVAIFDMDGFAERGAVSASCANISQSIRGTNIPPSDATFTKITSSDLNLASAGHPSAMSHKLYVAVARNGDFKNYPALLGLGGSYEFAAGDNALEQWALWLKLGLKFG